MVRSSFADWMVSEEHIDVLHGRHCNQIALLPLPIVHPRTKKTSPSVITSSEIAHLESSSIYLIGKSQLCYKCKEAPSHMLQQ